MKATTKWLDLVKDFNLNYAPSLLSFRADVNRQFGAIRPRNVGGPKGIIPETYDKYFTFDRYYNLRWDLTRSLNIDFTAVNRARVDEDSGRLDQAEKIYRDCRIKATEEEIAASLEEGLDAGVLFEINADD